MSYESEDHYWTDYLRVALPVIGLLLMLALFWWWAQQFIGDDGDPNDVAQATQTIIATAPALTPTATVPVSIASTPGADPTETPDGGESGNGESGGQTPGAEGEVQDCGFDQDQQVVTTTSELNLRDEAVIDPDNVITQFEEGTVLRIQADCFEEDDEGNQFWLVRNEETARTGYVAGEFLAPLEDEE